MNATTSALIILGAMVAAYIIARAFKLSPEVSILAAAVAGALSGGEGIPARHIVEGAFTYFDISLIFFTATLFMNILKEAGAVSFVVRRVIERFHRKKYQLFILLAILLLIPGALTGAGSVTVLIMGGMVSTVLASMEISRPKIAAIIFLIAGLSAAAPPVSLWAMLTAAGVNMPYVGFFVPLMLPCLLLALATIFILGRKSKPIEPGPVLKILPAAPEKMNWFRISLPFFGFFGLIIAGRMFPFSMPILGLPLIFMATAVVAFIVSPPRLNFFRISLETVHQLLPLIGTLTAAGILVQLMTLTGVRGLIAITVVTLPFFLVVSLLFLTLPISEAVLMWGAAPVLGVPLTLLFNTVGLNPIVALAGMSIIWPIGDALPPTAIIGRLTVITVGLEEGYNKFLRACLIPSLLIIAIGTIMVIFSKKLSFLTFF